MSLATVYSRAQYGVSAPLVTIETHISGGLPKFNIVGLPETAVKESRDRVRSALLHAGFEFPRRRITVNLGPADLPKEGARFDLAIALSVLSASGQLPKTWLKDFEFLGELSLSGQLRACHGTLASAIACSQAKRNLILPQSNQDEAGLIKNLTLYPASNLMQVVNHLNNIEHLQIYSPKELPKAKVHSGPDIADIKGQFQGKRALEIAASGRHSLLLVGPPGAGKSMLASRLVGLLPDLGQDEALQSLSLHSLAKQKLNIVHWQRPPFRHPHHSASGVALTGGGNPPRPGEISLAHNGVLFLDELPEFPRSVLENLREPIETGEITISRAAHSALFPANFQLVAAMNPCPCGFFTDPHKECVCSPAQHQRYINRISGPLLDRIDMIVHMPPTDHEDLILNNNMLTESSAKIRQRVLNTRKIQLPRQILNSSLSGDQLLSNTHLTSSDRQYLASIMEKLQLSARALHRILRVARTIADMDQCELIDKLHLNEAMTYRRSLYKK